MSAELLGFVLESAIASSVAMLLVLLVRRPLRRLFGARVAYASWWLVPVAIVSVTLPAGTVDPSAAAALPGGVARVGAIVAAIPAPAFDAYAGLVAAWGIGAIALALRLLQGQRRFHAELGPLQRRDDGSWGSRSARVGPAVVGAVRGRVVVPADFDTRYDAVQRDLVLRHERVHLARFDLAANLAATALRCVHWFNPLQHYAVSRFRFDQELAADAVVLSQRPQCRREYADAMLKTQLLTDPPPLGCHWQPAHPLKERILMLKQPLPGAARATLGTALALGLTLCTGYVAWAAQPAAQAAAAPVVKTTDVSFARIAPPAYPDTAKADKVAGTVMLRVLVAIDGAPAKVEVETSAGDARLDDSAVAKVRGWRFNPRLDDGKPVEQWVLVPVTFSLDGPPTEEEAVKPAPNQLDEIYIAPKQ